MQSHVSPPAQRAPQRRFPQCRAHQYGFSIQEQNRIGLPHHTALRQSRHKAGHSDSHASKFRESRLHNLTLSCPAAFGVLVYHVDYSLIAIFRVTEAITAGVIALLLIIYIRLYNRLRRLFIKVKEGNVSINVALEKRYDLLPQELEAVQKYLQHEHQVYTEVTALRTGKDLDEAAFLQKRSFFTFPS